MNKIRIILPEDKLINSDEIIMFNPNYKTLDNDYGKFNRDQTLSILEDFLKKSDFKMRMNLMLYKYKNNRDNTFLKIEEGESWIDTLPS